MSHQRLAALALLALLAAASSAHAASTVLARGCGAQVDTLIRTVEHQRQEAQP